MKKYSIFLLVLFPFFCFSQVGPDAGRNLVFSNAQTWRVNIPDAAILDHPGNTISVEAWIFPTAYPTNEGGGMVFNKHETVNSREYDLMLVAAGQVRFSVYDVASSPFITIGNARIPLNAWTHIAGTYSNATGVVNIYINGILDRTTNIGNVTIASTSTGPMIGGYWQINNTVSRAHFEGAIDEVRLWHAERTQAELRDNMCQTLRPQANLIAYYTLDETTGNIANDASGNNNNGILENFPAAQITNRNFSGAPVGNASVNTYSSNFPLSLGSVAGGSMSISNVTGNPTAIHLFRVDAVPSQTGGLTNPIDTYFGTFVVNGNTPTYDVLYDYSGTVFDGALCESNHKLQQRNDNAVANWTLIASILNTTTNTLSASNINSRIEIILDTTCATTLPVNFISFHASRLGSLVLVEWTTTDEKDIDYFEIERGSNLYDFVSIGKLDPQTNSHSFSKYLFEDIHPLFTIAYYRIKEVDKSGKYTYSDIRVVNAAANTSNAYRIYPNPGNGKITIEYFDRQNEQWNVRLFNIKGQELFMQSEEFSDNQQFLDFSNCAPGIYYLQLFSGHEMRTEKLIIQ